MALIKTYIPFGIGLLVMMCSVDRSLQDCDRPTDLDPNIIITPNLTTYVTYYYFDTSCQDGYDKTGPDRYYCQPGTPDYWNYGTSSDTLSCSVAGIPCSKPTFDDPAVVITPDKTSYSNGEVITASCTSGTLLGSDVATCQSDGSWDFASQPSCLSDCSAPQFSNGTGSYQHSAIVTFMCDTGYKLEGGGDYMYIDTTCDDGAWNPTVTCVSVGCLAPSIPAEVIIDDPSDDYEVNSKVTLMCNGNTTASGPEFSYCNETGQWNPDPMTLKCRDQCKTPSFDDSRIIHSSDLRKTSGQTFYDHEDIIRFSCMEGIFVDGPWKSTCHNGTWSPPIGGYRPVCKNNCTSPENMSNAGDVFLHSQGHVFECDSTPGMVRMGGPRSVCMDGVWTPRIRCALKKDLRSEL